MTGVNVAGGRSGTGGGSGVQTSTASEFALWVQPHWTVMQHRADRLVDRRDADDVLQEAMLRAWRRWPTFDPALGTPRAWLLAIVSDQARRVWRRRTRDGAPVDGAVGTGGRTRESDPDPPADDRITDLDLDRSIAALPDRQRQAIELYYFLDLPVADVAAAMECAEGTVRATLTAARASLRSRLADLR